ncbi:MAG: amylo-alpha-1,6-glucosidase [Ferruginibacter sp.]
MQQDFKDLSAKEYLLTNGIGGYCSSSFSGANTRRYHGLLVASFNPPTDRKVLVSKIEEKIIVNEKEYELSANQYPDNIHPKGFEYLANYKVENNQAVIDFKHDDFNVTKILSVVQEENTTIIQYTNNGTSTIQLELNPMLVYKDYHGLFKQADEFDFYTERSGETALKIFAKYEAEPLHINASAGNWNLHHSWYKNFELVVEDERGFPFKEDAMNLGTLSVSLIPGENITINFSTKENASLAIIPLKEKYFTDDKEVPAFVKDLEASSRQFIVQRKSTGGSTIIAGYHWFTDWGRDTMIAMRGISIATMRQEEAKSILQTFFKYLDKGMLPNRFPDYDEELEYNTIDATLWLFVTLYEYQQAFSDKDFIKSVLPYLKNIIDEHVSGTRYNIHVTDEGLLYGGEDGFQLTWMDARVDGFVVTPRIGCPVEINLLWYNALKIYQHFAKLCKIKVDNAITLLLSKFEQSFPEHFINGDGYLNDVVIPGYLADASIRPNQVYAVSLPFSPLKDKQKLKVLELVQENLLTDFGVRTLDINDADFKPLYEGDSWDRDNAYHQGTVWPFLWGEWALAHLSLQGFTAANCLHVWKASEKLQHHFYNEDCLMCISEIFDGLEPANGKGCVQQAWSVSMMLKVFLDARFNYSLINIKP